MGKNKLGWGGGGRSYLEIPVIGQQMALEQWQHVYLKLVEESLMTNS